MVNLLPLLHFCKTKPAGRVPPDAILLSVNKSMQKCLLLAEGISFAKFLSSLIGRSLISRPVTGGLPFGVTKKGKA